MSSYKVETLHGDHILVYDQSVDFKQAARDYISLQDQKDAFALVDLKILSNKLKEWKSQLPRVEPYFAVKSNDDPVILRTLAKLGCGFDCASKGEIELALNNKIAPSETIVYSHTIKTPEYIEYASKVGVNLMTFDNEEELHKIKKLHDSSRLLLRIVPSGPNATFGKKFGCDPEEEGPKLLEKAKEMGLSVVGIAFHSSNFFRRDNPDDICQAIKDAKKLFEIGQSLGHKMEILDIGGGFLGHQELGKLPLDQVVHKIRPTLDVHFPESSCVKILAEPGKFFVASAVSVCARVIAATKVKASRIFENPSSPDQEAYMYYVNDGIYGSFCGRLFEHYTPSGEPLMDPMDALGREEYPCIIYGPTCDGKDKIEVKEKMRKLSLGDWLIYPDIGAYSKVVSTNFNGFNPPKYAYFCDLETWSKINQ